MKKLFDKTLTITTQNNKKYTIEKKNIFIHDYSSKTVANVIRNGNNIFIINEIYSFDDNRIRFSYTEYKNAKFFSTIEKTANGDEIPVMVIEKYERLKNFIGSIGNITDLKSDISTKELNKTKDKPKILKLLMRKKEDTKVA